MKLVNSSKRNFENATSTRVLAIYAATPTFPPKNPGASPTPLNSSLSSDVTGPLAYIAAAAGASVLLLVLMILCVLVSRKRCVLRAV